MSLRDVVCVCAGRQRMHSRALVELLVMGHGCTVSDTTGCPYIAWLLRGRVAYTWTMRPP